MNDSFFNSFSETIWFNLNRESFVNLQKAAERADREFEKYIWRKKWKKRILNGFASMIFYYVNSMRHCS